MIRSDVSERSKDRREEVGGSDGWQLSIGEAQQLTRERCRMKVIIEPMALLRLGPWGWLTKVATGLGRSGEIRLVLNSDISEH